MKFFSNRTAFGFGLGLVALFTMFTGCGGSNSSSGGSGGSTSTSASITSYGTGTLEISSVNPTPSTYATMPGSIQITFNESAISPTVIDSIYSWPVTCTNTAQTIYPTSATISSSNAAIVVLSFDSFQQMPSGVTCTISPSASISDIYGNVLGSGVAFSYTTETGASSLPGVVYTPQSTQTYVYAPYPYYRYGGPGGNAGGENAPVAGYTIQALNAVAGQYIDQIQAVWAPNYGSTPAGPPTLNGGTYGETAGGSAASLSCPTSGTWRVAGFYGYAGYSSGQYVDALGLICDAQDGSSSTPYYSQLIGGVGGYSGGTYFTLQCPSGTFVTGFGVYSGDYLDSMYGIGCQ